MPVNCTNDHYEALERAVTSIQGGNRESARKNLELLLERHIDPENCREHLKTYLFASALAKKCESLPRNAENIYVRAYANRQIELFDILTNAFPLVFLSKRIVNELLLGHIAGRRNVVLIDIGIGTGSQMLELVRLLGARGLLPADFTIVGIEPSASSLKCAEKTIGDFMKNTSVNYRFVPIGKYVEDMSPQDWNDIGELGGDVIVNEAFSLHHVRPGTAADSRKNEVIGRIRDLKPIVFVLTEPHSDHENPCLTTRFRNAWAHYGQAFSVIDRIAIEDDARKAVKSMFFGREIEDILAAGEGDRCERHERAEMWLKRLEEEGFAATPIPLHLAEGSEFVTVARKDPYISLETDGNTIVAIIAATLRPTGKGRV